MWRARPAVVPVPSRSAVAGFRFPPEVIVLAVRWYLRFGLSYRDVEELLAERGIEVDHGAVHRWVRRFAPLLVDAARFTRHLRPLACGRNLRQGHRPVGLPLPRGRPVRAGHRRVRVDSQGHGGGTPVLPAGHDHLRRGAGRGRHRTWGVGWWNDTRIGERAWPSSWSVHVRLKRVRPGLVDAGRPSGRSPSTNRSRT
jgi:hypothetical protein